MADLKGKSGPPGNMNAFKHGLTAIQKRVAGTGNIATCETVVCLDKKDYGDARRKP